MPTIAELIRKELGVEKVTISEEDQKAGKTTVGNLTMDQVVKIAKEKMGDTLAKDLRGVVKQVLGTLVSMRYVTVEGKSPKEILKEVEEGKWDEKIK